MSAIYKVTLTFNNNGYGAGVNVFYCQNGASTQPSDAVVLGDLSNWMSSIYTAIRPYMSNLTTLQSGLVQVVNGANQVVRNVGSITPTVGGTAVGEGIANIVTLSAVARTNEPKVRGRKGFPGVLESSVQSQLLVNGAVASGTTALANWLAGWLAAGVRSYVAGVVSSKVVAFVPFNGTGQVKNIPGSQVTRKPFRGA